MKKMTMIPALALCLALLAAGCSGQSPGSLQTAGPTAAGSAPPKSPAATAAATAAPAGTQAPAETPAPQEDNLSPLIEPEQLITKQEAAALIGDVTDGAKSEQPVVGQKTCLYDSTAEDGPSLQISITQQAFMSNEYNTPESIYRTLKDNLDETAENQPVEGIGDEYFFGSPGLHILWDGCYVCIAAGNTSDPQVRDILGRAGAIAVAHLQELLAGR